MTDDPYIFSRSLVQIRPSGLRGERWRIEADLQALWYRGDYLSSAEWDLLSPQLSGNTRHSWERLWASSKDSEFRGQIWRLYGAFEIGPMEIAVGRMRNAFGNTRIFLSPLDRLDVLPALISQSGDRPGSETLRLGGRSGESWRWQGGYLWGRGASDERGFFHTQYLVRE